MSRVRYLCPLGGRACCTRASVCECVGVCVCVHPRTLDSIKFVFLHPSLVAHTNTFTDTLKFTLAHLRTARETGSEGGWGEGWIVKIKIQFTANARSVILCRLYRGGHRFRWFALWPHTHTHTHLLYLTYIHIIYRLANKVCFNKKLYRYSTSIQYYAHVYVCQSVCTI